MVQLLLYPLVEDTLMICLSDKDKTMATDDGQSWWRDARSQGISNGITGVDPEIVQFPYYRNVFVVYIEQIFLLCIWTNFFVL